MICVLGRNFILTLPGFFYLYFIIFIFLGSPYYFIYEGMVNMKYIFATHFVIIIFPITLFLINKLNNIDFAKKLNIYYKSPIIDKQPSSEFFILFYIVLGLTLTVTFIYLFKLDIIPLNYLISSLTTDINAQELARLREASTTTFNIGKFHRYKYFMSQLLPFLVILSIYKTKLSKSNIWYALAILLVLFSLYRFASDLQKKPILDFIVLLFLSSWIFRGKVNWKQLSILFSLIFFLLAIMYYYIMGMSSRTLLVMIDAIITRIMLSQTMSLYHYFTLFPEAHDFLYGLSLPNPAGIFPYEHFPLTKWVFINGLNNSWEIVGTAPSAFIGEIYANFGYSIMIISIVVLACILHVIQIKFIERERTILITAFYSYFVYLSSQFALTSGFVVVHLYLFIFLLVAIFFKDGYKIINSIISHEK